MRRGKDVEYIPHYNFEPFADKKYNKADLHIHTKGKNGSDGSLEPGEVVEAGLLAGLRAIAVTDHNAFGNSLAAAEYAYRYGLNGEIEVIPAMESSTNQGHVLLLGIDSPTPKGKSLKETIALTRLQNGLVIAAHPFLPHASSLRQENMDEVVDSPDEDYRFDGTEIVNGTARALTRLERGLIFNRSNDVATDYYRRKNKRNKLGAPIGNSDLHSKYAGQVVTIYEGDSVMQAIREGRTGVMLAKQTFGQDLAESIVFSQRALEWQMKMRRGLV
jgi:hypothetical protein